MSYINYAHTLTKEAELERTGSYQGYIQQEIETQVNRQGQHVWNEMQGISDGRTRSGSPQRREPRCVLASSFSSSALGSSGMGLPVRSSCIGYPPLTVGEFSMSSRVGTGRLHQLCQSFGSEHPDTNTYLGCRCICPPVRACWRTSERKDCTSSTIRRFMPSMPSSSSNPKSKDCNPRVSTARFCITVQLTEGQSGSSAGSCQTARYGWLSACSHVMRFAGSKLSSWASRSSASGFARGNSVEKDTRGLIGSERM